MNLSSTLLAPVRAHPWRAGLAVVLGALTALFGVGLMSSSGYLIAEAAKQPPILELMVLIVAVRFFGFARAGVRYAERLVSHDFLFRVLARLRSRVFAAVAHLGVELSSRHHTGDVMSRITDDVDTLEEGYLRVFSPLAVALISGAVSVGLVAMFDPKAALVVALCMVGAGVVAPAAAWWLGRADAREQVEQQGRLQQALADASAGRRDLRVLGDAERAVRDLRHNHRRAVGSVARRRSARHSVLDTATRAIADVAMIGAFIAVAPAVTAGDVNGPALVLIVLTAVAAFEAILPLASAISGVSASRRAARRIDELGDDASESTTTGGDDEAVAVPSAPPSIHVGNLRYRHRDGTAVFDGFDLDVEAGEQVAITGPSGSGKTTLLRLVAGLIAPDSGAIRIGGRPLQQWPESTLRQTVTVVEQHPHIFETTLRGNLIIAREDADDEELIDALEAVKLSDWFETLPDGLDTYLGEFGAPISGGERRRLGVARAFLRDAPVVLLDEPTAHLDEDSERAVLQALDTLLEQRTALTVTHRLVDPGRYDRVVSLSS